MRTSVFFSLVALYLLLPLLTSVHVEGFTAQIQIGAVAANAGRLHDANLLYPLHAEFFFLTRTGVVLLLRFLMWIVGTGDVAFRILVILSFALFTVTTLAIARRHSGHRIPVLAAAFLLIPGLAELGFYFNDNVVSAALGMLGLFLLPRPQDTAAIGRGLRAGLAGMALGLAIVSRPDALLLLPVAAGLVWMETTSLKRLVETGLLIGIGMLVAFWFCYVASGVTVLEAIQIGRYFDAIQASYRRYSTSVLMFLLFFGLPGLVLSPLGAWQFLRGATTRQKLVLLVLPAILLAFTVRSATETRHIYPLLAPFVVIHGAHGLAWVGAALKGGGAGRRVAAAWLGVLALVWLAPPILVPVSDGPRPIIGRIWSPLLWLRWQSAMNATLDTAGALAATTARRSVVLTTSFNPDHFMRLRLWQAGWQPRTPAAAWPGCSGGFETWGRGQQELDHIRTENPQLMAREPADYVEAVQVQRAFGCSGLVAGATLTVFDLAPHYFDSVIMRYLYEQVPGLRPRAVSFGWPPSLASAILAHLTPWQRGIVPHDTPIGQVAEVTPAQAATVSQLADDVVRTETASQASLAHGYDGLMATFRRGAWRSPR